MAAMADLHACDDSLLCTFEELDHYPDRGGGSYLGPIFAPDQGVDAPWPASVGPRIFAYLKPGYRGLEPALHALRNLAASVLVHIPGASRQLVLHFSWGNMRVTPEPLRMSQMAAQCTLAVCHGGAGTSAAMLLAGKPLLLLPMQMEQAMTAQRLARQGVACAVTIEAVAQLPQLLRQVMDDTALAQAAQAFAQRHQHYQLHTTIRWRCAPGLPTTRALCWCSRTTVARPRHSRPVFAWPAATMSACSTRTTSTCRTSWHALPRMSPAPTCRPVNFSCATTCMWNARTTAPPACSGKAGSTSPVSGICRTGSRWPTRSRRFRFRFRAAWSWRARTENAAIPGTLNSGAWNQPLQVVRPMATTLHDWIATPMSACMFRRSALLERFFAHAPAAPAELQMAGFWLLFQFAHHTGGILRIRETLTSCRLPDGAPSSYGYVGNPSDLGGKLITPPVAATLDWLAQFQQTEQAAMRQWLPPAWHAHFPTWCAAQVQVRPQ